MKDLNKDLAELKKLSGDDFTRKAAHRFIASGFDEVESELRQIKEDVLVRDQLAEVAKFVNLSYIAENYFHKSKTWLSQRIHGHVVSGKPRYLSDKDKKILNFALKDMADKLSSLTVS